VNHVTLLRNCVIHSGAKELTFDKQIKNIMKALRLVVVGLLLFYAGTAYAQISVNVNIGAPPVWGPSGYSDVRYYYIPDVEAYYDVPSAMFIYLNGGTWVHRTYLPSRYRNYDLYNGYKVVMTDYRGDAPYSHFSDHKVKYAKGYHGQPQKTYGERPHKANLNYNSYYKRNSDQHGNKSNDSRSNHEKNQGKNYKNGGGHEKNK
jgi:hypothetical protein